MHKETATTTSILSPDLSSFSIPEEPTHQAQHFIPVTKDLRETISTLSTSTASKRTTWSHWTPEEEHILLNEVGSSSMWEISQKLHDRTEDACSAHIHRLREKYHLPVKYRRWSNEETTELIRRWTNGEKWEAISAGIGRTPDACRARYYDVLEQMRS